MFGTIGDRPSEWESLLPAEVLRLPEDLARVDVLLDDPVFFAPFAAYFHPVIGRPSTPVECYLRLMFLKFRHRLGYESLCAEVSDSISWRRFCRIPLDGKVPHPATLMKLTTRCGEDAVAGLNEALWAKAAGARLLRTARVRADTTVICANVACPTDSGLLAKAVGKLVRTARRGQAAGGAPGTVMTGRRRTAARRVRQIASTLLALCRVRRVRTGRQGRPGAQAAGTRPGPRSARGTPVTSPRLLRGSARPGRVPAPCPRAVASGRAGGPPPEAGVKGALAAAGRQQPGPLPLARQRTGAGRSAMRSAPHPTRPALPVGQCHVRALTDWPAAITRSGWGRGCLP